MLWVLIVERPRIHCPFPSASPVSSRQYLPLSYLFLHTSFRSSFSVPETTKTQPAPTPQALCLAACRELRPALTQAFSLQMKGDDAAVGNALHAEKSQQVTVTLHPVPTPSPLPHGGADFPEQSSFRTTGGVIFPA